jgi:predicted small secreted protein
MRLYTVLILFAVVFTGACSTVEGIGKDIQKAGNAIEKAGSENR